MNSNNKLHKDHRDRMREKYDRCGHEAFDRHQLYEMLLYYSIPRSDTNPAAHSLCDFASPPDSMFRMTVKELARTNGVGPSSARLIKLSADTVRRTVLDSLLSAPLDTDSRRMLTVYTWYQGKAAGTVAAFYLDRSYKLITVSVLSSGRTARPESYTEKIAGDIVETNAKYMILTHNHAGGVRKPSVEDIYLTELVNRKAASLGCCLLTHYIATDTDCVTCPVQGAPDFSAEKKQ